MIAVQEGSAAELPQSGLFELIWQETSALRREAHHGPCPTTMAPYGERDPRGARLADACLAGACMDLVHEVYINIRPRLDERLRKLRQSGRLGDPVRYAHRAIKTEVAEIGRRRRVALGLPAKPSRSDGVPGRVIAVIVQRAEDDVATCWYEKLFRMMRSYACRPGAPGRGWPLDGWAQEKERLDERVRAVGRESVREEIRADIAWVQGVAVEVAGVKWVHHNITGPLQWSSAQVSLDAMDTDHCPHPTLESPDDAVWAGLVRWEYVKQCQRGTDHAQATRAALTTVYGNIPQHLSDDALRKVADSLELEVAM